MPHTTDCVYTMHYYPFQINGDANHLVDCFDVLYCTYYMYHTVYAIQVMHVRLIPLNEISLKKVEHLNFPLRENVR